MPALVMDGDVNKVFMSFMGESAKAIAKAMPNARRRTLESQTHDVNTEVLAPVLVEFFNG